MCWTELSTQWVSSSHAMSLAVGRTTDYGMTHLTTDGTVEGPRESGDGGLVLRRCIFATSWSTWLCVHKKEHVIFFMHLQLTCSD